MGLVGELQGQTGECNGKETARFVFETSLFISSKFELADEFYKELFV